MSRRGRGSGDNWAISDRSGFRFRMSEMIVEDGLLVHKSEADGQWSILKHPLNNLGKYLRGKNGDPFPIPNARPDIDWAEFMVFDGELNVGANFSMHIIERRISRATVTITGSASTSGVAGKYKNGGSTITSAATTTVIGNQRYLGVRATMNASASLTAAGQEQWKSSVAMAATASGYANGRKNAESSSFIMGTASLSSLGTASYKASVAIAASAAVEGKTVTITGVSVITASATTTINSVKWKRGVVSMTATASTTQVGSKGRPGVVAITATASTASSGFQRFYVSSSITATAATSQFGIRRKRGSVTMLASGRTTVSGTRVPVLTMISGQIITTPGTGSRLVPGNIDSIKIEAWGPGGGGSTPGSTYAFGSGGGAGAFVRRNAKAVLPGSQISFTVGAGGAGGIQTGSINVAGSNGSSATTVDGMTANPGYGANPAAGAGSGAVGVGGAGGLAFGGDFNSAGQSGQDSLSGAGVAAGDGGNSSLGYNGGSGGGATGAGGGAGATEGFDGDTTNPGNGGNGANGGVKFTWTGWGADNVVSDSRTLVTSGAPLLGTAYGLYFKPDGTCLYAVAIGSPEGGIVYQFNLSTAWDIATATYSGLSHDVTATVGISSQNLNFKPDGTIMYVGTSSVNRQYTLSTPWDLTTATYASKLHSHVAQAGSTSGNGRAYFAPDGVTYYIAGATDIFQYTMSTPWDISTATYASKTLAVSTPSGTVRGVAFKPDGLTMYLGDITSITQYTLTTPWDITTATLAGKQTIGVTMAALVIKTDDGTKAYGNGNNVTITQYSLSN